MITLPPKPSILYDIQPSFLRLDQEGDPPIVLQVCMSNNLNGCSPNLRDVGFGREREIERRGRKERGGRRV